MNSLNEAQKQAVTHSSGPLMVLAGAGSGKTRTLVTKIIYLMEEKGLQPFEILAMTFSNKAAQEMRERIIASTHIKEELLSVTTFHSFCAQLLRREATFIGLGRNFTIYDDSESRTVVKHLLAKRGIGTKEISPYDVLNFIDHLKNQGLGPELPKMHRDMQLYFDLYQEYQEELLKSNALDFGGLINAALELFEKHPQVKEKYQLRYKYILVDEYQDTNRAQLQLITLLVGREHNICVVGDEDQSIYSWRGADIRNILDFEKIFPDTTLIKLEQNYRSSKVIIDAATQVIAKNIARKGKNMWTSNDDGEKILIKQLSTDEEEAAFIASEINKLVKNGEKCNDIAVFYRSNAQSRLIEDALLKKNTPYRVVGGIKFYDRKEIKDLIAYMRLIVNPKDSLALSRIINVPGRGVGTVSLRKIEDAAIAHQISLFEMLERICQESDESNLLKLPKKVSEALSQLVFLIAELRQLDKNGESLKNIFEKMLHESGYLEMLKSSRDFESMNRVENVEEFLSAIVQFESSGNRNQVASVHGFLESITLDHSSLEKENELSAGQVSLMTIHGAKGLEFPHVFVAGLEENLFPSYKSLEDGERGIEEERRLFYVAMTRAMKHLTLSYALCRTLFGKPQFNGPSSFLFEIPEGYVNWDKPKRNDHDFFDPAHSEDYSQDYSTSDEYFTPIKRATAPKELHAFTFPVGKIVVHGLYGEGKVLHCEGRGPEEKVLIRFQDGVQKKFMVKFAPIVART